MGCPTILSPLRTLILKLGTFHCESGEGLWLQGEAALQMHSFRDADPQPVFPQNSKIIMEYPPSS